MEKLNQMVNFNVKTIKANHQGDCIGYRIKKESVDVTYIPDNQLHNETITPFDEFINFAKGINCSFMIANTQAQIYL